MARILCALLGALSILGWASTSLAQDVTPPSVTSITPATAGPSAAATETFTVTFSEFVTGVGTGDFTLMTTAGVTTAAVTGITGSGAVYLVNVSGITGVGSLRLDLKSSGTGIVDGALNPIAGGYTSGGVRTVSAAPPPASVPTMTEWAMILLGLMLAGAAALTIQRRRAAV
jgi:hypothetical protein